VASPIAQEPFIVVETGAAFGFRSPLLARSLKSILLGLRLSL